MSELDRKLRALCRATQAHAGPTAEDRDFVRTALRVRHGIALGAGAGVTLSASSVGASVGKGVGTAASAGASASSGVGAGMGGAAKVWLAKSTLVWFVGGLAGGGAVAVGGMVAAGRGEPERRAVSHVQHLTSTPTSGDAATSKSNGARASMGAAPASVVTQVTPLPSEPAPHSGVANVKESASMRSRAVAPSADATLGSGESRGSDLGAETRALADVQRALREGRSANALALLDAQDQAFRGGALATERRAARVFALAALGRIAEARPLARRFLAVHPTSPLAERLRAATGL